MEKLAGLPVKPFDDTPATGSVLICDAWDSKVQAHVRSGGSALLLADGDRTPGLERSDAPFWREMAIWLPKQHDAIGDFPHEEFVDLQFYDLTTRRPFLLNEDERKQITPIIWGTNSRHPGNQVFDYLFEKEHGEGKLVACCLNLTGEENIAGQHLLRNLLSYLRK